MHRFVEQPVIVIAAYNRPGSLKRLLTSVAAADYNASQNISLVISIDKSDTEEVSKLASGFNWKYGDKRIIRHGSNLGLREHILSCGDLTEEYESIILLEDDLVVSRAYYNFSVASLNFYRNSDIIAGISLYAYDVNPYARVGFQVIDDGFDTFFMQVPSSWGQIWTRKQWKNFKQHYDSIKDFEFDRRFLPDDVVSWPSTSWKKYFYRYMVDSDTYFVYPRTSYSTNFCDEGSHFLKNNRFQTNLRIRESSSYRFARLNDGLFYDGFYEMKPESLKKYVPELSSYDFETDLYGTKKTEDFRSEFIISNKDCSTSISSYGHEMIPREANIIFKNPGEYFVLGKLTDFNQVNRKKEYLMHRTNTKYGIINYRKFIVRDYLGDMFRSFLKKIKPNVFK